MSVLHPHSSNILPVQEEGCRPLWSVVIPTYNCAAYLRETLSSVLAQDLGPELMQIEVVDDHSTRDDPKAIVEELGRGRVNFYQQSRNVGYIKNFETCLQRSQGYLVHLLHGDDWVRDGFYTKMQDLFKKYPDAGAAFCRVIYADENGYWQGISSVEQPKSGILIDGFQKIYGGVDIQSAAMVVRREVYEHLGGFDHRFVCCFEDREMWVRVAVHYPIAYEVEPLAVYRCLSSGSLTKKTLRSGEYARDMYKGLEIIENDLLPYISKPIDKEVVSNSRENIALFILRLANQMLSQGDVEAALNQIRHALNCSNSLRVWREIIGIYSRAGKQRVKKQLSG